MRISTACLAAALVLGQQASAFAAATAEEAQRLTGVLQSYLGRTPGVVTVVPDGDGYAARIDRAPLLASLGDAVTLSLSPVTWTMAPENGGLWKITQDQPLSFAVKVAGAGGMTARAASVKSTGVFDEGLGGFASYDMQIDGLSCEQVTVEGGQTNHSAYQLGSVHYRSRMGGTGDDSNGTATYGFTDYRETVSQTGTGGSSPGFSYVVASPEGVQTTSFSGLRTRALRDLITWLVARPSTEAIAAGQAELKQKLRDALPVFRSITASTEMSRVSMTTALGQLTLTHIGSDTEMNGVVPDGFFRQTFSFGGLELPSGIVPGWAQGFIPKALSVDVSVSGYDLATPAAMLIDRMDLPSPQASPPGFEDQLAAALLPKGAVSIRLGPSEFRTDIFHLGGEGSMEAGLAMPPRGRGSLHVKGLDEVISALQQAPADADAQKLVAALLFAKGLARPQEGGAYGWDIDATASGALIVNGTDVSKMLGGLN